MHTAGVRGYSGRADTGALEETVRAASGLELADVEGLFAMVDERAPALTTAQWAEVDRSAAPHPVPGQDTAEACTEPAAVGRATEVTNESR
ncbi:hypothetical protein [Streptomyces sp. NPDC054783]